MQFGDRVYITSGRWHGCEGIFNCVINENTLEGPLVSVDVDGKATKHIYLFRLQKA